MRQFEVGDLCVIHFGDTIKTCNVSEIEREKHYIVAFCSKTRSSLFFNMSGVSIYSENVYIKHIRTPRKGGKEARDIVAMLTKELHKSRLDYHIYYRQHGWNHKFFVMKKQHEPTLDLMRRVDKAKKMLGASDDS